MSDGIITRVAAVGLALALSTLTLSTNLAAQESPLAPLRGTEFSLEDLNGFSVVFVMDGQSVSELQFHQPNGIFTATPIQAEE